MASEVIVPADDDWDADEDKWDCQRCDEYGMVMACVDDLCHGQGWCMHGNMVVCPECGGWSKL